MRSFPKFFCFVFAISTFMAVSLQSPDAHASWAEFWARGHGSYVGGDEEKLRYFSSNDAGLGYGFAAGVEIVQIDAFIETNFHPGGSMFNLVGLGMDFDLTPGDTIYFAPAGHVAYFFAPHEDSDASSDRGLLFRGGLQFEVRLFPMTFFGIDGYGGGLLSTYGEAEAELGWYFQASTYLTFRFGI